MERECVKEGTARKLHAEANATSAKLRLFLACGKDLTCLKDKLNFGGGKILEMTKERTPVDRQIPEYQKLSKKLNMVEGKRRMVGGMESPSKNNYKFWEFVYILGGGGANKGMKLLVHPNVFDATDGGGGTG